MCYSARIKTSLKELSSEFRAKVDLDSFAQLFQARLADPGLKIPFGIDRYFVLSQDPAEARLAGAVRAFHEAEKVKNQQALNAAEREAGALVKPTAANKKKTGVLERRIVKLKSKLALAFDRLDPSDERIYPLYFAPALAAAGPGRIFRAMRYRIQNPDGSEIPGQYNVFNARRDSLLTARSWAPLFGKHHAIFPFVRFYEWVVGPEGKKEIFFAPEDRKIMWAASLFSSPPKSLSSFAMITNDPPPEVAAAGHDRCPIFLSSGSFETWLHPQKSTRDELFALLQSQEKTHYLHGLSA